MRGVLVHAHGRRHHAAAHVGNAAALERTLDRTVLAALTVEHRERHVHRELAELRAVHQLEQAAAALARAAGHEHHRVDVVLLPGAAHHVCHVAGVMEPGARAVDADEDRGKAVRRQLGDDVVRGLEGDIVLGGDAAEDDGYVQHGCPFAAFAEGCKAPSISESYGDRRHGEYRRVYPSREPRARRHQVPDSHYTHYHFM